MGNEVFKSLDLVSTLTRKHLKKVRDACEESKTEAVKCITEFEYREQFCGIYHF